MEGDPGAVEKLYRLRLVLPDLSQSFVGNWLASLEKSIPPELFHDFDDLFDAPERKSGKSADVNVFKHSVIKAQSKNQTSARENEDSKDAIWQTAKSCKRHELWLRAGELASRGPEVHTWEVCHRLENWLLEKASEGSRELSLYLTHANSSTFASNINAGELNGGEMPSTSSPRSQPINIPESDLVRDSLYALQGIPAAVRKLERLSRVYCTTSTDKSNLTTLWTRSVTASALGKVLAVVARAGHVRCHLDAFVRFFLDDRADPLEEVSNEAPKLSRKTYKKKKRTAAGNKGTEKLTRDATGPGKAPVSADLEVPRRCLVNQAFAAAVKGILRGHSAALNSLATSISLRRDQETGCSCRGSHLGEQDPDPGPVIGYGNRDITLLEFYLHTKELRVQLHSLAFICLMKEGKSFVGRTISDACLEEDSMDINDNEVELGLGNCRKSRTKGDVKGNGDPLVQSFEKFPRGANLLTYLYNQLMEVDPLHMKLLRFLFESAYEPYSIFVESWLYQAAVRDPYGEFIIEQADFSVASSSSMTSGKLLADPHPRELKLRSGIYVPRFMENICSPLIRAGEQLQVLLKIADTCELAQQMANNTRTYEKFWPEDYTESLKESRGDSAYLPALVFSKRKLEENAKLRERKSQEMSENFDILFTELASRHSMERSRASSLSGTPKNLSLDSDNFEIEDNQVLLADPEPQQETWKGPLSKISGIEDVRDTKHLEVTVTLPKRGWVTSEKDKPATDDSLSSNSRSLWRVGSKDGLMSLALKEMEDTDIQPARVTADASGLTLDPRDSIELWFNTDPTRVSKGLKSDEGSSEVLSLVSGYQRGTSWQLWGLPINPFLVQADVEDSAPNAYVYPNFTGTYQHWDVTAKPSLASVTSCPEKSRGSPRYGRKSNIEPSWFPRLELALNGQLFAGLDAQLELPSWSQADVVYAGEEAGQWGLPEFHDLLPVKADLSPIHPLGSPRIDDAGPDALTSSSPVAQSKSSDPVAFTSPQTLIDAQNLLPDLHAETKPPTDLMSRQSAHIENILPRESLAESESVDGSDALSPLLTEINIGNDPSENDVIKPYPSDLETGESDLVKVAVASEILDLSKLLKLSDLESDEMTSRAPNRDIATTTSNISGFDEGKAVHSSEQMNSRSWESNEVQGPARWEQHLRFSDAFSPRAIQETSYDCADEDDVCAEEIPLSVVVSKCIAEEILSQYQSVSTLTVRLFQEGLCLQDHYTALRRYYFMERGDWAEYFTTALCQHKWGPLGGQLRQMEVQGMLEAAFQRSSCEGDVYAERVYVSFQESRPYSENFIHGSSNMPTAYVDTSSLDAFDFIALQYRVDWPLSLIITNHSLSLYNVVFTFLMRIKLTVHALGDIWHRLQLIDRSLQKGRVASSSQQQRNRFRTLQQFRQQIYHFVVTLQRYVESKLLNVVWSKFLQDIQSEVNDMQDLEIVHRAYLEEATAECFLSTKTRGVKGCIDSIMQCVLDFSSHMRNAFWSREKLDLIDDNLFMQVHQVKKGFQTSLQQLHGYHKKQEPQSRTNLNDLWMILDYNGFLTTALSGPRS